MRVSAAGNMPLQGLVKPPAKPVVMIKGFRRNVKSIFDLHHGYAFPPFGEL